jgi:glyoxylase-like metal-dependent hydrolase (beta-lactamase superfamily II)
MEMIPQVILPGILIRDLGGNIRDASSSVTLISSEDKGNILIDTGERSRRPDLISALKSKAGIEPPDINLIINTHIHHDHTGNNRIFENAEVFVHPAEFGGMDESRFDFTPIKEGIEVAASPRVYIIETPGHTEGSITIIVEADKIYAVTGDALPLRDNYTEWVPPGINIDPALALKSMDLIVKIADIVIPGHGNLFNID